jgi:hypothetical protein
MAVSFDQLVAELKSFDRRREIVKAMSQGIRKAAPSVRSKIKRVAMESLPAAGGLNAWVAKIRISTKVRTSGRRAGVVLTGGRNSDGGRSDINAIDRGRVRAPTFGHRSKNSWHTVTVQPGFFTRTAAEATEWRSQVDAEVDKALDELRRG